MGQADDQIASDAAIVDARLQALEQPIPGVPSLVAAQRSLRRLVDLALKSTEARRLQLPKLPPGPVREVIVRPRAGGKTHEMVEWLRRDPDRVMVCVTEQEAARLRKTYPDIDDRRFVAAHAMRGVPARSTANVRLGVDNADWLLEIYLGAPVDALSLTGWPVAAPWLEDESPDEMGG